MESTTANFNLKLELCKLSEEFDCLGLPTINIIVDVLYQVITTSSRLVQMYRQSLIKLQETELSSSQFEEELRIKKKKIDLLKDEIKDNEKHLGNQTKNYKNVLRDIDDLKMTLKERDCDLKRSRDFNKHQEEQFLHKVKNLELEIDRLKGDAPKNIQSVDKQVIRRLERYKANEKVYEETIKLLQENNDELHRQILNLREDILIIMNQKQNVST